MYTSIHEFTRALHDVLQTAFRPSGFSSVTRIFLACQNKIRVETPTATDQGRPLPTKVDRRRPLQTIMARSLSRSGYLDQTRSCGCEMISLGLHWGPARSGVLSRYQRVFTSVLRPETDWYGIMYLILSLIDCVQVPIYLLCCLSHGRCHLNVVS